MSVGVGVGAGGRCDTKGNQPPTGLAAVHKDTSFSSWEEELSGQQRAATALLPLEAGSLLLAAVEGHVQCLSLPVGGGGIICIPGDQEGLPWPLAARHREDDRSVPRAHSSFPVTSSLGVL